MNLLDWHSIAGLACNMQGWDKFETAVRSGMSKTGYAYSNKDEPGESR